MRWAVLAIVPLVATGFSAYGLDQEELIEQTRQDNAAQRRMERGPSISDSLNCVDAFRHSSELDRLLFQAKKLAAKDRDGLIQKIASEIKARPKIPANFYDADQVARREQDNDLRNSEGRASSEPYFQNQDLADTKKCVLGFNNSNDEPQRQNISKLVEALQKIEQQNGPSSTGSTTTPAQANQ